MWEEVGTGYKWGCEGSSLLSHILLECVIGFLRWEYLKREVLILLVWVFRSVRSCSVTYLGVWVWGCFSRGVCICGWLHWGCFGKANYVGLNCWSLVVYRCIVNMV